MYRHILIPTDGSRLSQNAIAHGVALAKSINAKVTILTVSTPFHTFAVEPEMVTDTSEQYSKHMTNRAAKYLNSAKEAAAAAGVNCDTVHVEHEMLSTGNRSGECRSYSASKTTTSYHSGLPMTSNGLVLVLPEPKGTADVHGTRKRC
jgi:hypothetical protein